MLHTSLKYFKQVLSVVTQFDVSEAECLKAAHLRKIPETGRVNADCVSKILSFTADRLNDPMIAIKCALKYPILQYTQPAEILKLCENIEHAADVYRTYSPLFHTLGKSSNVITENQTDRMIWVPNFNPEHVDDYRLHVELIMTNYMTSINWLVWKIPNAVLQLNIRHDPVAPIEQYQDLLGCDVKFNQSEYALLLKDNVKAVAFETSDPIALSKIQEKLDKAMNALFEQESLVDRIELQIRRAIERELPKKANTAKALDMSERSMVRALAERGTNYKKIKDRVIRDLAVGKINQGLPLAQIAHSLGYNDQSAFTRAYKRWFGYPPGKGKPSQRN